MTSDSDLRKLVQLIITGDSSGVSGMLAQSPSLGRDYFFSQGATRQNAKEYFVDEVARYVVKGDTALHFAAAAYKTRMVRELINAGSKVGAKNRLGDEPLHSAAVGSPGSPQWNPWAQSATISCLIEAGADPNAVDKFGVTPLHRAVRTRCAAAVETLLACGADASRSNKSGSTPMLLATLNTGRSGSGSVEAKVQQEEILRLLKLSMAQTGEG